MKPNDFVSVHFPYGCVIGRLVSVEADDTCTVEFDNGTMEGIPKERITLWVSTQNNQGDII